jgi:hypothetical protein
VHQSFGRWVAYIGHHGGIPEAEKPVNPLTGQESSTAPRSSTSPIRRIPNTWRTSRATKAITKPAARRWCGCATASPCPRAIQTRSTYIYIVDRANNGMHILELTGPAREVANFPE